MPSRAERYNKRPGHELRFLEPQALRRLRNLRLAARRIVEGTFAGRHRSRLRGTSVEFADYREYTPGDDLRRLDWKAFVRLGRPYLRTYDEETNLRCLLMLDTSTSMDFGAEGKQRVSKLDYARFLLAALGYLVVQSRDQAGLALGADRLETYLEPQAHSGHLNRILHSLEQVRPVARTDLPALLKELYPLVRRRAVLILCSDFLEVALDDFFMALRALRHRGFEVVLFHLLHPLERDLPPGAAYHFVDPEGASSVDASPAEIRTEYRKLLDSFLDKVRHQALACGCDYELLHTDVPYPEALERYLRFRESIG